jgi:hypothetical protein
MNAQQHSDLEQLVGMIDAPLHIVADHSLDAVILEVDDIQIVLGIPAAIDTILAMVGAIDRLQDRAQLERALRTD